MKFLGFLILWALVGNTLKAQDAIVISEGNFVRGVIKGTNFDVVAIQLENNSMAQYEAKNIQSFIWNGQTYVSKPIIINKKAAVRFFKLIEGGTVNLYSMGDMASTENEKAPKIEKRRMKPTFGVGLGTGGFSGMGGGISFGGGGNNAQMQNQLPNTNLGWRVTYYIEKPGTGPIQEITLDPAKVNGTKTLLLQKLSSDDELATKIKATERFNDKNLPELVRIYNEKLE
jgi:hypothetical protein